MTTVVAQNNGPTFTERLARLKDAFPPDKVRWRIVQKPRNGQTRGLAVAYLSMGDVEDHLDNVMGPDRWRCSYPVVGPRFVICRIDLKDDAGEWIGKEDGSADNVASNASDDDFDKDTKAVLSDSKKRACRAWGIGRYLATVEKPWIDCEQRGNSWIIAEYEYARLAHLVGGEAPPQNQQRQQQQPPPQQQYQGPPPEYQGGDRPPASPRQQQQPPQQHQGQGGYQNTPHQGQSQQQGGRPPKTFTIPFGKNKGTLIQDADEKDLLYCINAKLNSDDPRYAKANQEWVAAANAELARRRGNAGGGNANNGNGGYAPPANTQGPPARQDRPPPPNNGYQQRQQQAAPQQQPPQQQYQGPPPQDNWPPDGSNGDDIPF